MVRGVPGFVRIGAALAGCALVAACTPDPGPTVTPTTAPPSSASPSVSVTPSETDVERQQRQDWEAAEKAYRTAVAVTQRLAQKGGVQRPSPDLAAAATGQYLDTQMFTLQTIKKRGWRLTGSIEILGVKRSGGWSADTLQLVTCEDNSGWNLLDQKGKDVTPRDLTDYLQSVTVKRTSRGWKAAEVKTRKVEVLTINQCGAA